MTNQHYVYGLTDDSGIRYIGITNNPARRLKEHLKASGANNHKNNWLRKNKNKVQQLILSEAMTRADALIYEIEVIKLYRLMGCQLLNVENGGQTGAYGIKRSAETRKKLSLLHAGKTLSDAHKASIKASCKGINTGNKGRMGRPHKSETIAKIKLATAKQKLPVVQCDIFGNELMVFPSATDASTQLNICMSSIRSCLSGRYKTAGGFGWKRLTCNAIVLNEREERVHG